MSSSSDFPATQLPGSNAGAGSGAVSSEAPDLHSPIYQEFIQPLDDYIANLIKEIEANPDKEYGSKLGWISGFPLRVKLEAAQALRAAIDSGDKTALNHPAFYQGRLGEIFHKISSIKSRSFDFMEAARSGDVSLIRLLLLAGAYVNAKDSRDWTALYWAARNGHAEVVKILGAAGADLNAKNCWGDTVLHRAAGMGELKVVKALDAAGADMNAWNYCGYTALHEASKNGHVEVVKDLLLAGADLNAGNSFGYKALHWAARSGHVEVVKALLLAGADVNAKDDRYGETALHWAAMNNRVEVVKALGAAGADMNAWNYCGYTALHEAARSGRAEAVDALFSLGVDASIKSLTLNKTALQFAREANNTAMINILQDDQALYLGPMGKTSLRGIWVRAAVLSAKTMHSSDRVEEMSSPPTQLPGSNAGAGGPSP